MVNLITTNCNLLEINCTFKLFSIIQNSNKEYSDVTIRRTKNEFKIDIKNHESQDFIFLLNQNKINAKIIQPKTPFFVTNLPNGISQSELSEGISSITLKNWLYKWTTPITTPPQYNGILGGWFVCSIQDVIRRMK